MNIYEIPKKCRYFALLAASIILFAAPSEVFARAGCFLGDTSILTPSGEIPVSELKSGDDITSFNVDTGEKETSRIGNVSIYGEDGYYLINGKIGVTRAHPFYVDRGGAMHIVEVKDLNIGDQMFSEDGSMVTVDSLELKKTPAAVYNLEDVSPDNNYYADDILVHNKGGGGCFLPDTQIETPDGLKAVSALNAGDKVISWDEAGKSRQVSVLGRVDVFEVDDYYVINGDIKVTGTHPFYVSSPGGMVLKEVETLKTGDHLTDGLKDTVIYSIKHVAAHATVYNLVDVRPFNNYFADGVLVHNKGGGGGGSHGGSGGHSTPFVYNGKSYSSLETCATIADPQGRKACESYFITGIYYTLGFFVVIIGFIAFGARRKGYSSLKGKKFTEDADLIAYVQKIVPAFTNTYDQYYSSDTENWSPMRPPPEVSPALYQNLSSVDVLRARIQELYARYEYDWTTRNFEAMKAYMKEPYYSKQKQIFDSSFGHNFDITYKPEILSATPMSVDLKIDGQTVKFQINGRMVDFEVSSSGNVLSGVPDVRDFTEFWHVFIDLDKNYFIIDVEN